MCWVKALARRMSFHLLCVAAVLCDIPFNTVDSTCTEFPFEIVCAIHPYNTSVFKLCPLYLAGKNSRTASPRDVSRKLALLAIRALFVRITPGSFLTSELYATLGLQWFVVVIVPEVLFLRRNLDYRLTKRSIPQRVFLLFIPLMQCLPIPEKWYIVYRNYENDPLFGGKAQCGKFLSLGPEEDGAFPMKLQFKHWSM